MKRTKAGKADGPAHIVALSTQTLTVLRELHHVPNGSSEVGRPAGLCPLQSSPDLPVRWSPAKCRGAVMRRNDVRFALQQDSLQATDDMRPGGMRVPPEAATSAVIRRSFPHCN